ncbi:FAD binding domain-containing protein [Chloroflexota bacterium]
MGTRVLRDFEYLKPISVDETVSLLERYGNEASILAGGTDLLVSLKLLRISPKYLIDITGIGELGGVTGGENETRIGATTTIKELARSVLIYEKYTALGEAAQQMGTTQMRQVATIGGNLCRASAGADTAPPLLALKARAEIYRRTGGRTIPLAEFFIGPGQSALTPGEILTAITIPAPAPHTGSSFIRINGTVSELPQLSAAATVVTENDQCTSARIALGAVAPTPVRARQAEKLLISKELNREVVEAAAHKVTEEISPRTSFRSSADYRRDVAAVIVKRALIKAYERSRGAPSG